MFHLAIADCIVSGVTMPLEAIWRFTVQVYSCLGLEKDNILVKHIFIQFKDLYK